MTGQRYDVMFAARRLQGEGAFVPFLTLGDPDPVTSARLLETIVAAGADALELGLPFSDPVADGSAIQASAGRALMTGTTVAGCWQLVADARRRHPSLPIGLLVYANLTTRRGLASFYRDAARAGVDSVLVADLPVDEAGPWVAAATAEGIAPTLIVPPNADAARIDRIAKLTRGYTYVTTRGGVTGEDRQHGNDLAERLSLIARASAPPAVLGFGISAPDQVRRGLSAGAAGVIAGSAVVRRIAEHLGDEAQMLEATGAFVRAMKDATRPHSRLGVYGRRGEWVHVTHDTG